MVAPCQPLFQNLPVGNLASKDNIIYNKYFSGCMQICQFLSVTVHFIKQDASSHDQVDRLMDTCVINPCTRTLQSSLHLAMNKQRKNNCGCLKFENDTHFWKVTFTAKHVFPHYNYP